MRVLAVNAGSSSLKLALVEDGRTLAEHQPALARDGSIDAAALEQALSRLPSEPDAVGHRIVHGGERFGGAALIDAGVERALRELVELAPLHQPKSLAALDAVTRALPGLPAVACFDTAFHATLPPASATYALPAPWRERWRLRRYGFHGLSHSWVARRAPQLLGAGASGARIVSCHLGAGASLCAIAGGVSRDTTMGFTPLEGLVMATRSGSVDPGMLMWLLERERLEPAAMATALEHESGLLGLAGSADMREVERGAAGGEARAQLALDVYVHRLRAGIAAMAAASGGVDVLAFTGGVGENSATVRALAAAGLGFLGVAIDAEANAAASPDAELSADQARVRTLVVRAREDLEIARQTSELLASPAA